MCSPVNYRKKDNQEEIEAREYQQRTLENNYHVPNTHYLINRKRKKAAVA